MSISPEQFIQHLAQSGLLSEAEVASFQQSLPPQHRAQDAEALAQELVRAGKLTAYQARSLCDGQREALVFGEYRVLDKLGQGGMGLVLKAEHRRMKRLVAVKMVADSVIRSPESVKRFYREVEAAARLDHPNIVTAHDAGEQAGVHYLVMQYIDGKDLRAVVQQRGPMDVVHAVECIVQVARGLEYAHSKGIIHRDIKPSNLLLDREGVVKILDMGLARSIAEEEDPQTERLTASGQVMGSCDYMAPEQAMETMTADTRADIYSLGCTLHHLLTGEVPYRGKTLAKIIWAHQQAPVPSLCAARSDVPPELDAVFQKMVAKQPDERYASMAEVIDALESWLGRRAGAVRFPADVFEPNADPQTLGDLSSLGQDWVQHGALARKAATGARRAPPTDDVVKPATDKGFDLTREYLRAARHRRIRLLAIALGLLGGAALVFLAVTIRIRRADGPDTAITAPTGSQVTIGADGKVEVVLPAAATAQHESMAMVLPVRPLTEDRLAAIPGARLALDRQQTAAARLGLPVQITNSLGMRLMLIPPGEFEMGSTREFIAAEIQRVRQSRAPGNYWTMVLSEEPRHRVRISRAFYLGACAVTQAEYEKLMGVNPSDLADQQPGAAASEPAARDAAQHTLAIAGKPAGRDTRRHPVDRVLWEEAREFCRKLSSLPAERAAGRSYRLPTEAEWEYACRAGTAARWFPGEAEGDLLSCAWFEANAEDRTHAVGQKTPNAWGLYDMHGNVWQWCADWFDAGYYRRSPEKDPNGALAGTVRVKRGGCFSRGAAYCRSAARGSGRAADREAGNGFRVVLEIAAGVESGDRQPDSAPTVAPPRAARPDQPPPAAAEASFDSPKAQAHQKAWARHFRLSVVETNSIGMRLAVIPPGTFDMGSRPEEVARALRNAQQDEESPSYPTQVQAETPEHRVRISKPFCLGVYPVTQREYAQVMGVNPSSFTEKQREAASFTPPLDLKDTQERAENLHQVRGQDTSRHPVEMVTWDDALEFCQRLSALPAERAAGRSYRLPSEAEWKHACRAGTTTRWFAGDDVADLPSSAWFAENAQGTTHAVGQKRPNAWGLHDMQGNVWQWCADWFNPDYYKHSPASDPRGPTIGSMCVMRGGSWFSPAQSCRSAFRLASGPGTRNARGGFRVAMDLPEFSPAEPTSP